MLSPSFTPFPELLSKRLLLRKLILADAPAVQLLRSDEEVMKYINRPLTLTIGDAEKWVQMALDSLDKNEGITWAISLKEAPDMHIGNIGLWRIEMENYRAEIGYMLDPSLQGKGIMFEALEKVVDYGFTIMKLHSIEARLDPRNVASSAVVRKAGFVQEALFKENYFIRGSFADTAVYSILNKDNRIESKV